MLTMMYILCIVIMLYAREYHCQELKIQSSNSYFVHLTLTHKASSRASKRDISTSKFFDPHNIAWWHNTRAISRI